MDVCKLYSLVEQEVDKRVEWAKGWQLRGVKHYAAGNINAAYDIVIAFEKSIIDMDSVNDKFKSWDFADSMRLKLGRAIDEIAQFRN